MPLSEQEMSRRQWRMWAGRDLFKTEDERPDYAEIERRKKAFGAIRSEDEDYDGLTRHAARYFVSDSDKSGQLLQALEAD